MEQFDPAAGEIPAHLEMHIPPEPIPWRRIVLASVGAAAFSEIVEPLNRIQDLLGWLGG